MQPSALAWLMIHSEHAALRPSARPHRPVRRRRAGGRPRGRSLLAVGLALTCLAAPAAAQAAPLPLDQAEVGVDSGQ